MQRRENRSSEEAFAKLNIVFSDIFDHRRRHAYKYKVFGKKSHYKIVILQLGPGMRPESTNIDATGWESVHTDKRF